MRSCCDLSAKSGQACPLRYDNHVTMCVDQVTVMCGACDTDTHMVHAQNEAIVTSTYTHSTICTGVQCIRWAGVGAVFYGGYLSEVACVSLLCLPGHTYSKHKLIG